MSAIGFLNSCRRPDSDNNYANVLVAENTRS